MISGNRGLDLGMQILTLRFTVDVSLISEIGDASIPNQLAAFSSRINV